MWRPIVIALIVCLSLSILGNSDRALPDSSRTVRDAKLYTFSSNDQYFLSDAQPFILPPGTPLKETLDRLGKHLAETYFSRTAANKLTSIHFEIMRIEKIDTPSRPLYLAVVNMVDPNRDAMEYFFQGSTGGQTTFCMLGATFMQPHLESPLLDGLIILYNGELLPELDHINLSGVLIPRLFRFVAIRAIHGTQREPV